MDPETTIRRPFMRGCLFGMAICEILASDSEYGNLGAETTMTLRMAEALCADGEFRTDNLSTYVKELLLWFRATNPDINNGYIKHSIALALNVWGRYMATSPLRMEEGGGLGMETMTARFQEGQEAVKNEIGLFNSDGAGLTRVVPIALSFAFTDRDSLDRGCASVSRLTALTHPQLHITLISSTFSHLLYHSFPVFKDNEAGPVGVILCMSKQTLAEKFASQVRDIDQTYLSERYQMWQNPTSSEYFKKQSTMFVDRFRPYTTIDAWKARQVADLNPTASALDTFEAALWCFFARDTFAAGAVEATSMGGDAKTIAAVYGALAGAYYGYDAIPAEWVRVVAEPKVLDDVSERLGRLREGLKAGFAVGASQV
ncbi:hypothetical protein FQN50_003798 [Emmonsiellopsis sp. PD_5]|nr:hypothetical protein FQN50_003798 [Emmonsiellopsis sp. PD_5]